MNQGDAEYLIIYNLIIVLTNNKRTNDTHIQLFISIHSRSTWPTIIYLYYIYAKQRSNKKTKKGENMDACVYKLAHSL